MAYRSLRTALVVPVVVIGLAGCSSSGGGNRERNNPPPPPGLSTGPADCVGGKAADFDCLGVSLRARVPHADMGGSAGSDIWGWVDAMTGNEYALVGMTDGTAFVDVTDPEAPVFLGRLPTNAGTAPWRDIKVYADHAYIVADGAGAHGMQVFDLTRLRAVAAPQVFSADVVYGDFGSAHNLAINEDSGFAYVVGISSGAVTCDEGLHMVDISTPLNPMFAGCYTGFDVHDAQCVHYAGPDPDHAGAEVCVSSASNVVEIADVTLKPAPVNISQVVYPDLGFVHQAWLTEDHRYLFVGDEFDENVFFTPTRTIVIDVADLDNPAYVYTYEATTSSIDHNLYVLGNRLYQANYTSGLRVIEFNDPGTQDLVEIAFFDTFPDSDDPTFDGAWSVFPYLPSGNLIVNDDANGLFVLTMQ
ncbi:MAG: choice-of-anchor B family protein [Woeseiaceae bacterium]|nr:choice-of-anchor B family protein [Woeseiaceae bacterium]